MRINLSSNANRDRGESTNSGRLQARISGGRARFGISVACLWFLGLSVATTACGDSTSRSPSGKGGSKAKGGSSGATDGGASNGGVGGTAGAVTEATAGAVSGGTTGTPAAAAGQAAMPTPTCVTPAKWVGALKPIPTISVGKPVFTNSDDMANKGLLVDGKYKVANGMAFRPMTATTPIWFSVDVGTGFTKLLLTWRDVGYEDFGPSMWPQTDYKSATSPLAYLIKTSADSTDGNDGTWTTAATVTGNEARSRSHVFDFTAMRWVRFEVTASVEVVAGSMRVVRLDELELHDMSTIGPDDYPDSWFMMGDSITKMCLDRSRGVGEIDKLIAAKRPAFAPAVVTAGNGGEKTADAIRHLKTEEWLKYSEGLKFVTLAFGTNDSWNTNTPVGNNFEVYLREVIEILRANGRVPVLTRFPWNNKGGKLADHNAVIDRLQAEFELPCGPDLYNWFLYHPEELSNDGVHPSTNATGPSGATSINRLYSEAMLPLYPAP